MLLELIFNVLLRNVTDGRTDDIASPWAPCRSQKVFRVPNGFTVKQYFWSFFNRRPVVSLLFSPNFNHFINKQLPLAQYPVSYHQLAVWVTHPPDIRNTVRSRQNNSEQPEKYFI